MLTNGIFVRKLTSVVSRSAGHWTGQPLDYTREWVLGRAIFGASCVVASVGLVWQIGSMCRDNSNRSYRALPVLDHRAGQDTGKVPSLESKATTPLQSEGKWTDSHEKLVHRILHTLQEHDVVTLLKLCQTPAAMDAEFLCGLWRAILAPDGKVEYDKQATDILCALLGKDSGRSGGHWGHLELELSRVFDIASDGRRCELVGHLLADKRFLHALAAPKGSSEGRPTIRRGSPAVAKALDNVVCKGDAGVLVELRQKLGFGPSGLEMFDFYEGGIDAFLKRCVSEGKVELTELVLGQAFSSNDLRGLRRVCNKLMPLALTRRDSRMVAALCFAHNRIMGTPTLPMLQCLLDGVRECERPTSEDTVAREREQLLRVLRASLRETGWSATSAWDSVRQLIDVQKESSRLVRSLLSFRPDKHSQFRDDIVQMSQKTEADFPLSVVKPKEVSAGSAGTAAGSFPFPFQHTIITTVLASSADKEFLGSGPSGPTGSIVTSAAQWQTMWRLVDTSAIQVSEEFWAHTLMLALSSLTQAAAAAAAAAGSAGTAPSSGIRLPFAPRKDATAVALSQAKFDLETVLVIAQRKGRRWPVEQLKMALVHVLRRLDSKDVSDKALVQALLIAACPKDRKALAIFAMVASAAFGRTEMVRVLTSPCHSSDDDLFSHPWLRNVRPSVEDADNAALAAVAWLPVGPRSV